jgi:collagenase-like PrtC family protease
MPYTSVHRALARGLKPAIRLTTLPRSSSMPIPIGRVYVTVNTLLYDGEVPEAVRLLHRLYDLGVDAAIIQDVGLLECDLPPLALIASTQMHNHTPERVAFLEQIGFRRVILARELSLDQIRAIRSRTVIELESFVHGSLCVSYSGQCYLSYAIGGRSGNRGECAQPCRRKYTLVDRDGRPVVAGRHLLSLRDLNLTGYLDDLLEAGVTSFKIEGRLNERVTQIVPLLSRPVPPRS